MFITAPTDSIDAYGQLGFHMDDNVGQTIRPLITSQWRFNTSGLLVDSVGTNTLTNVSSVSQSTSDYKEGNASAQFNSTNDYLTRADNAGLKGNQDFTISCWVKFGSLGVAQALVAKDNVTNREFALYIAGSNLLSCFIANGVTSVEVLSSGVTASAGVWYHVAMTHDISIKFIRIFVNGIRRASLNYSLTSGTTTNPFIIGSDNRVGGISLTDTSKLDNVIWCQSVLTDTQIKYLHAHPDFYLV